MSSASIGTSYSSRSSPKLKSFSSLIWLDDCGYVEFEESIGGYPGFNEMELLTDEVVFEIDSFCYKMAG